jgi:predicted short-subunit dehydrogenase-like oxidoreductase (DUF2520 family)
MDAAPDVPDTWPLVGVIGAGRVGSAVLRACAAAGVPLLGVASREEVTGRTMAADVGTTYLPALEILRRAELTVLSVPDPLLVQVAADLARGLQDSGGGTTQAGTAPADAMSPAVVHCSGALDAGPLAPLAGLGLRTGAWHPLQAFATRHTALAMDVTWGITADEPLRTDLRRLTVRLGGHPVDIPAAAKVRYHAAAAHTSNHLVTLLTQGADVLKGCGLSHDDAVAALTTLMRTSLDAVAAHGVPDALTGPLVRGDAATVARHLGALAAYPQVAALYRAAGRATLPLAQRRGVSPEALAALATALASASPEA